MAINVLPDDYPKREGFRLLIRLEDVSFFLDTSNPLARTTFVWESLVDKGSRFLLHR